jgi:hypothetical protein
LQIECNEKRNIIIIIIMLSVSYALAKLLGNSYAAAPKGDDDLQTCGFSLLWLGCVID